MGYTDGSAYEVGNGKNLIHFITGDSQFITSTQMIGDAIVTTKDHRSHQAQQLFGFGLRNFLIAGGSFFLLLDQLFFGGLSIFYLGIVILLRDLKGAAFAKQEEATIDQCSDSGSRC